MERIDQLWMNLEDQSSDRSGIFKTRYSETSEADVYLGIMVPEMYRLLILCIPFDKGRKFDFKYEFKGVKFEKLIDPYDSEIVLLCLKLVDFQLKDIFNTLCLDIIDSIINDSEITLIQQKFKSRLLKWQNLFDRYNSEGLSLEEQRGLYGELYFMREWMSICPDFERIVSAWLGPERELQDFQSDNWAVEVKTTFANNHQKIHIHSERQLDSSHLSYLYLYHLSLEVRQNGGENLNQIIQQVRKILASNQMAYSLFNIKLMKAGYFDNHSDHYKVKGYFIRESKFYNVVDQFPRIQENDLMNGVGDVSYSIVASSLSKFTIADKLVFDNLITNEQDR